MVAFVTGATGFVGCHIVRALLESGEPVRYLARPSSEHDNLKELDERLLERVEGDLRDPASFEHRLVGCRALFHCAADYRLFARDPQELYQTNVEGTRGILRAAGQAGVERIVYTSSVGALVPSSDGTPVDETAPSTLDQMVGHYKRSKFLAERVAEELSAEGLPVVIVSPSTPIGELDIKPTPTGQILVDFLNRRMPAYVDTGLNLIDVRDVALGHLLAAEKGSVGEKYILGNRDMTLVEILDRLSEQTGLPRVTVRLPHAIPIGFAALATAFARLFGTTPRVSLESALMARKRMFFSSTKAIRELGLPQTPVEEALARAVWWFTSRGYVTRGPLASPS